MDVTRIEQELARIRQDREKFFHEAVRQVAAYDGAIQALEHLLQPEPAVAEEAPE